MAHSHVSHARPRYLCVALRYTCEDHKLMLWVYKVTAVVLLFLDLVDFHPAGVSVDKDPQYLMSISSNETMAGWQSGRVPDQ